MKKIILIVSSLFLMTFTPIFAADDIGEDMSNIEVEKCVSNTEVEKDVSNIEVEKNMSKPKEKTKGDKPSSSSENEGHYTIHVKTSKGNVNINDTEGTYAWWTGSSVEYNLEAIKAYVKNELKLDNNTEITLSEPKITGKPGNGGNTTSIHFTATISTTPIEDDNTGGNTGGDTDIDSGNTGGDIGNGDNTTGNGDASGDSNISGGDNNTSGGTTGGDTNPGDEDNNISGGDAGGNNTTGGDTNSGGGDTSGDNNTNNENIIGDDSINIESGINNSDAKDENSYNIVEDKIIGTTASYIDEQPRTGDETAVHIALITLILTSIIGLAIGLRRKLPHSI